jgi:hypothetical protein
MAGFETHVGAEQLRCDRYDGVRFGSAARTLNNHFDPALLARLIATNWIRTAAWTGRAGLAIAMLVAVLRL